MIGEGWNILPFSEKSSYLPLITNRIPLRIFFLTFCLQIPVRLGVNKQKYYSLAVIVSLHVRYETKKIDNERSRQINRETKRTSPLKEFPSFLNLSAGYISLDKKAYENISLFSRA